MTLEPPRNDDWYDSEEPTRVGLVTELQRIRRRTLVRPLPVIALAIVVTAAVMYKVATKERLYYADVVLALNEGTYTTNHSGIPFDQLKEYATNALLPDPGLLAVIEKNNLHRLRRTLGDQWAIGELRAQIEIEIWKNTFIYYQDAEYNARKSARIGLTVIDPDPDVAVAVAHDLASLAIETHESTRQQLGDALARDVKLMRETMNRRLADIASAITVKQAALGDAQKRGKSDLVAAMVVDLSTLAHEHKKVDEQLALITASPEAFADDAIRAGLGTTLAVVEERRPERPENRNVLLVMVAFVVGTCALIGSALFVGAFDSRIHDTDDVARLGLPVLGHVPGFPGDHVGSLATRSAVAARVPSFERWRSSQ